jgi:thymidylate kinase
VAFFTAIARAYDEIAAADPGRIAVIDAAQAPEAVLADALAQLS